MLMWVLVFAWLTTAGQPLGTIAFYPTEDACNAAADTHVKEIGHDPVQSNGVWACLAAPLTLPTVQPKGSI